MRDNADDEDADEGDADDEDADDDARFNIHTDICSPIGMYTMYTILYIQYNPG